jgi:hypothetical protein
LFAPVGENTNRRQECLQITQTAKKRHSSFSLYSQKFLNFEKTQNYGNPANQFKIR